MQPSFSLKVENPAAVFILHYPRVVGHSRPGRSYQLYGGRVQIAVPQNLANGLTWTQAYITHKCMSNHTHATCTHRSHTCELSTILARHPSLDLIFQVLHEDSERSCVLTSRSRGHVGERCVAPLIHEMFLKTYVCNMLSVSCELEGHVMTTCHKLCSISHMHLCQPFQNLTLKGVAAQYKQSSPHVCVPHSLNITAQHGSGNDLQA